MKAGRPLWWAAGLSLCLLLAAAVVVVLVRGGDQDPAATPAERPNRSERAVLAAQALQQLERAVTAGNASDGSPEDGPQAVVVTNAQKIGVRDFSLHYVDEDPGALSAGSDEWVAAVETTWAFRGVDRSVAHTEVSFTFRQVEDQADGQVVITAIGERGRRTPLWLAGPVSVRRAPGVLVIAGGGAAVAERYLGLATRSVSVVGRVLPDWREWPGGLVVEVPRTTRQLVAELDAEPGEYDQIAAVTTTVDGSLGERSPVHVFANADVFGPLAPQGARVVLSHEATHVATGAATATMPLWLVEGFADYVALRDVDLPLSVTASQIADEVREEGPSDALPSDAEFDNGTTHLGASYEAAWLACTTLADLGTEEQLVAFYDAVRDGGTPAAELRRIFGISQRLLTQTWRGRLQDLAG